MDWDNLKVFLAVAEAGSLVGASRRLGLSQATVWRRVQALEDALATTLFERRAVGYALTPAGTVLLRRLAGVHAKVEAAGHGLTNDIDVAEGDVRVTAPEFAGLMVAEGLGKLAQRHPRLVVELLTRSPIAALAARDVDIALRVEPLPAGAFALESIYAIPFGLYATPAYLTKFGVPRALDEFDGHRLIEFDYSMAHLAPKLWQRVGGKGATVVFRSNSPNARLTAAQTGLGLALLPSPMVGDDQRLRQVLSNEDVGNLDLMMFIRAEMQRDARIGAVRDFLVELFAPYKRAAAKHRGRRREAARA